VNPGRTALMVNLSNHEGIAPAVMQIASWFDKRTVKQ
jgi:hypothetical protein